MSKFYKVSEEELRSLISAAIILDIIEGAMPTGLEGFDEDVEPEDMDLSDYEEV